MKRDPSWVIWVIQSMRPVGFAYGAVSSRTGCRRGFPSWSTSRWAPQALPPRSCGAGNPPGRPVFPQLRVRGRWGWRCSPARWAPPSQHSPGQAGAGRPGGIAAAALGPSRVGPPQGRVESLIWPAPGRGEMTAGGVSIAPARRFVPGHAQPVQQLPHRGTRGTAALHIECSFPWDCGAAARNRSIPRTADGQYPTRWTTSCRLWRRWLLGGTALDTCYGAAGVSMWYQRERSPGPAPLMALIR